MRLSLSSLIIPCLLLASGCSNAPDDPVLAYKQGDYQTALRGFEARAASGDVEASNVLGVMYQLGLAVQPDIARAEELFRQAALAGSADAQNNLGMLYQRGQGVPQDLKLAYGWFDLASRSGHLVAKAHAEAIGAQLSANMAKLGRESVDHLVRGDSAGLNPPAEEAAVPLPEQAAAPAPGPAAEPATEEAAGPAPEPAAIPAPDSAAPTTQP